MREYAATVTAILVSVIAFLLSVFFTAWEIEKIIFVTFWAFMLTYPVFIKIMGGEG